MTSDEFHDPQSHKIIGLTPAGKYHLRYLSLNTDYLVRKRANRSSARDILPVLDLLPSLTRRQREWVEDSAFAIPDIDSPPRSSE